ncbi:hypothetical protein [Methylobacterium haplocladii]|uniref:Uncharacterized protein n=1 Tax=Methylobacterium haplocladii TaxID=1176176 RepID=A0A512IS80_9HYPH|nr:hypothetical protein [Methylobacterium haplocladii]GEP00543.1 hypothetical protein MHA02_29300 [Methylobacterium haplocladii]GJD85456.1 hypothetical protein HPGCJGGD_3345 [Methylobacterium haplocladii]GLS57843.1 hypothetical protein GCM10007887_04990 [Methylobacterium haplocladii]
MDIVTEFTIADARRAMDAQLAPDALRSILSERQGRGLAVFIGSRAYVGRPACVAETEHQRIALALWAEGFTDMLCERLDLTQPLGLGTAVLVGVERDGTVRVTTWSRRQADCAGMKGWADRAVFPGLSRLPFTTHFGWNNGGVPIPLTEAERRTLTYLPPAYQAAWLKAA